MELPIAIVDKRRQAANVSEVMNIIGEVEGKTCIIVDDMVDTAGTLCNAAQALIEKGGAKEVYACATHGVLSGPAFERIEKSPLKELVFLDTIAPRQSPSLQQAGLSPHRLGLCRSHRAHLRRNLHGDPVRLREV
jgi:ribose-phosphate pyrophosphokinase